MLRKTVCPRCANGVPMACQWRHCPLFLPLYCRSPHAASHPTNRPQIRRIFRAPPAWTIPSGCSICKAFLFVASQFVKAPQNGTDANSRLWNWGLSCFAHGRPSSLWLPPHFHPRRLRPSPIFKENQTCYSIDLPFPISDSTPAPCYISNRRPDPEPDPIQTDLRPAICRRTPRDRAPPGNTKRTQFSPQP
jgi:hypothetical protein